MRFYGCPFAVGDTIIKVQNPYTRQLIDTFNKSMLSLKVISTTSLTNTESSKEANWSPTSVGPIDWLKSKIDDVPSKFAIVGRYILVLDIFDRISVTESCVGGEIHLSDALSKLDEVYGGAI